MFLDPGNYQSNPGCTCGSGRTSRSTASYHQSMSTTHGDAYHRWKHWCLVSVTTRYCFLCNCVFLSQTLPVFDCSLLDRFLYRFKAAPSKLAAFGHAGRLICWLVNNIAMTPVFFIPSAAGCPSGHLRKFLVLLDAQRAWLVIQTPSNLVPKISVSMDPLFKAILRYSSLCYFHQGKEKATATPKNRWNTISSIYLGKSNKHNKVM